jgi:hypothetical protein
MNIKRVGFLLFVTGLMIPICSCSSDHSGKPNTSISPPDIESNIDLNTQEILGSSYYKEIFPLGDKVKGKIVVKTFAGTSGFGLTFSDASWVIAYLENMQLHWQIGQGDIPGNIFGLLNSPEYGNGYQPIPIDKMYANEICDINKEIANAVGKKIQGLSIGRNCFNFCFPEGMELDTTLVPTKEGKNALRVFWEQW